MERDLYSQTSCIRVGYQTDENGIIVFSSFLLGRGVGRNERLYSINVVGITPGEAISQAISEEVPPPLPIPRSMLDNPDDVCNYLKTIGHAVLAPHLTRLNPDTPPDSNNKGS